jgi:hypothetical protein
MRMDFIMMPIPADKFTAVCALLGGAAIAIQRPAVQETVRPTAAAPEAAGEQQAPAGAEASPPVNEPVGEGERDAHGHLWHADLHASTKTKTKDGLWRMKVGVARPDPVPGFPIDNGGQSAGTGTSSETSTPSATSPTATAPESAPPATSGPEEDDEFAAFRAAAATSDAKDQAAAASVPARQYSDADLGALCNQAAVKLGDPNPIKEIIASFMPEGQVAHSRNVPAERRAEFVKAVEDKAGISFAG